MIKLSTWRSGKVLGWSSLSGLLLTSLTFSQSLVSAQSPPIFTTRTVTITISSKTSTIKAGATAMGLDLAVVPASTGTGPTLAPGEFTYTLQGCYSKPSSGASPYALQEFVVPDRVGEDNLTARACLEECASLVVPTDSSFYDFVSVEDGKSCLCGSLLSSAVSLVASSKCSLPCPANGSVSCGGPGFAVVYFHAASSSSPNASAIAAALGAKASAPPAGSSLAPGIFGPPAGSVVVEGPGPDGGDGGADPDAASAAQKDAAGGDPLGGGGGRGGSGTSAGVVVGTIFALAAVVGLAVFFVWWARRRRERRPDGGGDPRFASPGGDAQVGVGAAVGGRGGEKDGNHHRIPSIAFPPRLTLTEAEARRLFDMLPADAAPKPVEWRRFDSFDAGGRFSPKESSPTTSGGGGGGSRPGSVTGLRGSSVGSASTGGGSMAVLGARPTDDAPFSPPSWSSAFAHHGRHDTDTGLRDSDTISPEAHARMMHADAVAAQGVIKWRNSFSAESSSSTTSADHSTATAANDALPPPPRRYTAYRPPQEPRPESPPLPALPGVRTPMPPLASGSGMAGQAQGGPSARHTGYNRAQPPPPLSSLLPRHHRVSISPSLATTASGSTVSWADLEPTGSAAPAPLFASKPNPKSLAASSASLDHERGVVAVVDSSAGDAGGGPSSAASSSRPPPRRTLPASPSIGPAPPRLPPLPPISPPSAVFSATRGLTSGSDAGLALSPTTPTAAGSMAALNADAAAGRQSWTRRRYSTPFPPPGSYAMLRRESLQGDYDGVRVGPGGVGGSAGTTAPLEGPGGGGGGMQAPVHKGLPPLPSTVRELGEAEEEEENRPGGEGGIDGVDDGELPDESPLGASMRRPFTFAAVPLTPVRATTTAARDYNAEYGMGAADETPVLSRQISDFTVHTVGSGGGGTDADEVSPTTDAAAGQSGMRGQEGHVPDRIESKKDR